MLQKCVLPLDTLSVSKGLTDTVSCIIAGQNVNISACTENACLWIFNGDATVYHNGDIYASFEIADEYKLLHKLLKTQTTAV